MKKTEDMVRSEAEKILGFDEDEKGVKQGTGQTTTFNRLGFKGVADKPDGWYLPSDKAHTAIILEAKAESVDISKQTCADELLKNVAIVRKKYAHVVGILYSGRDIRIWKDTDEVKSGLSSKLEHKSYYTRLFEENRIDTGRIYTLTQRINNLLHFKFGVSDLKERMVFTACALVCQSENPNGLQKCKGEGYDFVHSWINNKLAQAIAADGGKKNLKLDILVQEFNKIDPSDKKRTDDLDEMIDAICEISDLINSNYWNGEDVMAIFFNEFNRYRGKSQLGQVLTPDHVTSFMCRLIDVGKDDRVLDAACGTGAFLVKAMCKMMQDAGGYQTKTAERIRREQLFGIEFDKKMYALACANMLIHRDGKSNIDQANSLTKEAGEWIRTKGITKVLMNPPYEAKYKPLDIMANVMGNVPKGTLCAFILPDKKLEKQNGWKLLKDHTLKKIVKMPEDLFFGIGVTASIFVFEAGKPQNGQSIIGYYIEDDGLVTVKSQGRQDVKNQWQEREDYWIKAIHDGEDPKYGTKQIIEPAKDRLSYPTPEKPFEIHEEDFIKTLMDYELFQRGIDAKEFADSLTQKVLYSSTVAETAAAVTISIPKGAAE